MKPNPKQFQTPVLLIVFNRPEVTKKSFDQIKKIKPQNLFIAADGPRKGNTKDKVRCKEVRKIFDKIDWPCNIKKLYHEKNQGCRIAESSAVTWLFQNVEEGIILEDDSYPNQSFFKFAEEMLKKYKHDDRIMHISGNNFQRGAKRDKYSYYFSRYPFIWGWATWKRAWNKYDIKTKIYPEIKQKGYMKDLWENKFERNIMKKNLNAVHYKNFDTWDYQWEFTLAVNNGLSIVPNENLVTNIGMVPDSTHMTILDKERSLPTKELEFPLRHPPFVIRDKKSDSEYFRWVFFQKIRNFILRKTKLIHFFNLNK